MAIHVFVKLQNRDFPRPHLAPSQFKNTQKLSKMVYIILNFLVLYFGENFMKIQSKIPKLQMHEKLHKNLNEHLFSFAFYAIFHEFLWWAIKAALHC